RGRQQLAVGVVSGALKDDLADALDDPAVELSLNQQGINDCPKIVDAAVFDDFDCAALRIDFHFGDVTPVRKCRRNGVGQMTDIEGLRAILDNRQAGSHLGGEFQNINPAVSACNEESAGIKFNIAGSGLQHGACKHPATLDDLCGRLED